MKNKIFTLISFTFLLVLFSASNIFAQAKSTFAGDVNVDPLSGREFGRQKLTIAYNGDVYVSRLLRLTGEADWGGYQILKSTDGGLTFTDIIGVIAVPAARIYTDMDIVACGDNAADFKLVVARTFRDAMSGESEISFGWYNSDGTSGYALLDESVYTYTTTRGWDAISISSDTKDPATSSAPYSISIAAIKAGIQDSIILWTGNTGTTNLTRRGLAATGNYFRNISCATGSVDNQPFAKAGIVWDEMIGSGTQYGNVKAHFVWAQDGSDFSNSGPHDVGVTDNVYRRPVIAMANNNGGNADIHGTVAYESDASLSGNGVNIYVRQFDQLNGGVPQITTLQTSLALGDGPGDQVNPHIAYNPADDKFLYTYYNAANDALVYKAADFNAAITVAPVLADLNYRDNQSTMTDPFPRVDGLTASNNYFVWTDQPNTFIDLETRWPASVQNTSVSVSDIKLYPNPATDHISLSFTSEHYDKAMLSIIDMSGRTIQNMEATIAKGTNTLPITLNNLPSGNYTLRLSGAHTNTAIMFTVQQ